MTTPENTPTPKRPAKWQWVLMALLALVVIGQLFGGNSKTTSTSSTTTSTSSIQKADTGTHMACEHWRINLANASVETLAEQIKHAQEVNKYASVSSNPEIVSNARSMTEAYINQDSEAYLTYATAFGNLCKAAGE
jgi:hypothetical protein